MRLSSAHFHRPRPDAKDPNSAEDEQSFTQDSSRRSSEPGTSSGQLSSGQQTADYFEEYQLQQADWRRDLFGPKMQASMPALAATILENMVHTLRVKPLPEYLPVEGFMEICGPVGLSGHSGHHADALAMEATIRMNMVHTLRVKLLPDCLTVDEFMEAVALLGGRDYDYLHMPIHNKDGKLQGFAYINFPVVEDAAAFCLAVWGHHFGECGPAEIDIAKYQGSARRIVVFFLLVAGPN